MERESFSDPEVGAALNAAFIPVKVDREERPDVDSIYMTVCQAMTGSGGWPLTVILTPDQKPFFAGTYFPKKSSFGRIGLLELTQRIRELWSTRREQLLTVAAQNMAVLAAGAKRGGEGTIEPAVLDRGFSQLAAAYDAQHGGFGFAPKFPAPHNLIFLLRYWKRTGEQKALAMVEETLVAMRRGGIYDQIGYGFHRYSTDERWFAPHFEKMLYDQAMLLLAYLEAYQVTNRGFYRQTVEEVFTYLLREMHDPSGGFYSAEDADSEGVEGKFYLWTGSEVEKVLSPDEKALVTAYFNLTPDGNFRSHDHPEGVNLFYLKTDLAEVAQQLRLSPGEAEALLASARMKLYTYRRRRVAPFKDDKILTDWNGLLLAALAKGGRVLQAPEWIRTAEKTAEFLLTAMRSPDGGLWHRYRQGEAGIPGFLDDYAFLIWGLLELFETTFKTNYLAEALALNTYLRQYFLDEEEGGYFQTSLTGEKVPIRQKDLYDGAIPSGNSVMMLNLLRLARLTGDPSWQQEAERISAFFAGRVMTAPENYAHFLSALDFAFGPSQEVVIVGRRGEELTEKMLTHLATTFHPRRVVLFRPSDELHPAITELSPFTQELTALEGKTTAYICRDYQCSQPTTDWTHFRELIEG